MGHTVRVRGYLHVHYVRVSGHGFLKACLVGVVQVAPQLAPECIVPRHVAWVFLHMCLYVVFCVMICVYFLKVVLLCPAVAVVPVREKEILLQRYCCRENCSETIKRRGAA